MTFPTDLYGVNCMSFGEIWCFDRTVLGKNITLLVVNYGISNTNVLEIP